MGTLDAEHFSGNLYYRGSTLGLSDEELQRILEGYEFALVVDVNPTPDIRIAMHTTLISEYVSYDERDFKRMLDVAMKVRNSIRLGNILIVSGDGLNRAPAICTLALSNQLNSEEVKQIVESKGILCIPYFRRLAGV